jgi:hypothetical protein
MHRLIVIVPVVIMLFELTHEKSIWSIPVKQVERHIMLYYSDVPIIDYQISNIYILWYVLRMYYESIIRVNMQRYYIVHTLSRRVLAYSVSIIIVTATIFSTILVSVWTKTAFGDGLTQEQLTASLGNRKADLLIKMTPPVVTTETLQKARNLLLNSDCLTQMQTNRLVM